MDANVVARVEPLVLTWLGVLGACVGSFLNVAIFRMPRRCMSVFRPRRSFCPKCRRQLTWYENVPVVSWVVQGGKCRGCGEGISARYPGVELFTALTFGWLAWRVLEGRLLEGEAWGVFFVWSGFASALIVCTMTDFDHRIIPDEIDIPGMLLMPVLVGLVPAAFAGTVMEVEWVLGWVEATFRSPLVWWGAEGVLGPVEWLRGVAAGSPGGALRASAVFSSVVGAAVGAGVIWGTGAMFSRMLGKESMGFGDVKYMGMIGGLAGWEGVVLTVLVACVSGSVGGILHMGWSGRGEIRRKDVNDPTLTPLRSMALALTGARLGSEEGDPEEVLAIRPGTRVFARFATGDPYVPFGPFLSVGAAAAVFAPAATWGVVRGLAGAA